MRDELVIEKDGNAYTMELVNRWTGVRMELTRKKTVLALGDGAACDEVMIRNIDQVGEDLMVCDATVTAAGEALGSSVFFGGNKACAVRVSLTEPMVDEGVVVGGSTEGVTGMTRA